MSEFNRKSFETRIFKAEFTSQMQRQYDKFPFYEFELIVFMKQRLMGDGDLQLMTEEPIIIVMPDRSQQNITFIKQSDEECSQN
ncbi:hypothetical protein OXYTRIMIC_490 [Oxytricha trifallax]|uniref:Uncharacterized protein n=1 Tax=Oxytricha trifallax TaxID=1172189 RepID=A0A073IC74_9SPIT|nr:hypothetical protein OXYTRIMIC_490 [Oxytricha trifallax]